MVFWHIFTNGPKEKVRAHRAHEFELLAQLFGSLVIWLPVHLAQIIVKRTVFGNEVLATAGASDGGFNFTAVAHNSFILPKPLYINRSNGRHAQAL